MIDLDMLEELAKPSGVYIGDNRPPTLDEVFERIVADGWAPRSPASELECKNFDWPPVTGRGKCMEPLILDGDVCFVDPRTPPQSGDLVFFEVSQRGAQAWSKAGLRKGDGVMKLYVNFRGIGTIIENHGGAAAASYVTRESSDETAMRLFPIRNIARAGRLLFEVPNARAR